MKNLKTLKQHSRHDPILVGDNKSYLVLGHFPATTLEQHLPKKMHIPSDDVMHTSFPTSVEVPGHHPFLMMFSNCYNVHDVMTEWNLRPYREVMFFIPVSVSHNGETRLCSYVPVLYLDFLFGVIGGLYIGLRKQYHPGMVDRESGGQKTFFIKNTIDASFTQLRTDEGLDLNPFFESVFCHPTVTVSYAGRTRFYTTTINTSKLIIASANLSWNFRGSVIQDNKYTISCYCEYSFTTSHAMKYNKYFHQRKTNG